MNISEEDWIVHKARHQELLWVAAKERLAQEARRSPPGRLLSGFNFIQGITAVFVSWNSRPHKKPLSQAALFIYPIRPAWEEVNRFVFDKILRGLAIFIWGSHAE